MNKQQLEKILNKIKIINEFFKVTIRKTNHYRYAVFYNNIEIMRTKLSFGSKKKSGDVKNIANDLYLRVDELKPYSRCNMSNEEYFERLKEKNLIPA